MQVKLLDAGQQESFMSEVEDGAEAEAPAPPAPPRARCLLCGAGCPWSPWARLDSSPSRRRRDTSPCTHPADADFLSERTRLGAPRGSRGCCQETGSPWGLQPY